MNSPSVHYEIAPGDYALIDGMLYQAALSHGYLHCEDCALCADRSFCKYFPCKVQNRKDKTDIVFVQALQDEIYQPLILVNNRLLRRTYTGSCPENCEGCFFKNSRLAVCEAIRCQHTYAHHARTDFYVYQEINVVRMPFQSWVGTSQLKG